MLDFCVDIKRLPPENEANYAKEYLSLTKKTVD
jgi:hypothetical protein